MKREFLKKSVGFVWWLLLGLTASDALSKPLAFAEPFGRQMVLQRGMPVRIWGTSDSRARIRVEIADRYAETNADSLGDWCVVLPELIAGGPYRLKLVSDNASTLIDSVYVGEVWIAAGQSNMGFQIAAMGRDEARRVAASADNRQIRFMTVPKKLYGERFAPDEHLEWKLAVDPDVEQMSAVAYFFAARLHSQLNVPLGILVTPHGDSSAEAWVAREVLRADPKTKPLLDRCEEYLSEHGEEDAAAEYDQYMQALKTYRAAAVSGQKPLRNPARPYGPYSPGWPGGLYETMLKRIIPYTARGVIWYQGESNNTRAEQYRTLLPLLIGEWRREFHNPDLYFCIVQLPAYRGPRTETWPELREAQLLTAQCVPHAALAVTIDAGERNNLHPSDKRTVGERVAALAGSEVYGIAQPHRGPELKEVLRQGASLVLTFDTWSGALTTLDRKPLRGFFVAEEQGNFVEAQAEIDGDRIRIWAEEVQHPALVRYGWANWTECNLCNEAGFPASPFRTDDRPLLSNGKYR